MVDLDESCSVRVASFDDEHKQMLSMINRLYLAMSSGKCALQVARGGLNRRRQPPRIFGVDYFHSSRCILDAVVAKYGFDPIR